jgi:hypothetical protein
MANTAATNHVLVRDSVHSATGVASTAAANILSTANVYLIPFTDSDKVMFKLGVAFCEASTEQSYGVGVYTGDQWRGGAIASAISSASGSTAFYMPFVMNTTSSHYHEWYFGPFDCAQFGHESTSTSFGAERHDKYLKVFYVDTTSSGHGLTSAGVASGKAYDPPLLVAIAFPSVVYSS